MAAIQFDAKINASELNQLLRELENGSKTAAKTINDALGGTVTKKLVLQTETDESGARKLIAVEKERLSVTDQIITQKQKLEKIEADSVTSLRQQVNEAKQARDQIAKYSTLIDGIDGKVKVINDRWDAQNQKVVALQKKLSEVDGSGFWQKLKGDLGVQGLVSFGNGLTQITQGFQSASIVIGQVIGSVNQLINALSDLQRFDLVFQAINTGAFGAAAAFDEASNISLGLGVNLNTVRDAFTKLSPVITSNGGSISDVSDVVDALSSRFAAFGLSGDEAKRVMNGISQAFSKGKLMAEELTQQIGEADSAFGTDLANALGVSTSEMLDMVKAGEITTEVLIKILPELGKTELLFGKLGSSASDAAAAVDSGSVTIEQATNKIAALNQLSFEEVARSFQPIIQGVLNINAAFSDLFTTLSKSSLVDTIGSTVGGVLTAISGLVSGFNTLATGASTVLEPIAKIVNALLQIPGASELIGLAIIGKVIPSITQLGASFIKNTGALSGYGGKLLETLTSFDKFGAAIKNAMTSSDSLFQEYTKLSKSVVTLSAANQFASTQVAAYGTEVDGLTKKLQALRDKQDRMQKSGFTLGADKLATEISNVSNQLTSAQEKLDKYSKIQEETATNASKASARLNDLGTSITGTSNVTSSVSGTFKAFGGAISGIVGSAKNAIAGITAAIGPLGIALIGVGIITNAYQKSQEDAAKVTDEWAKKTDALQKTIDSLKGKTLDSEPPITGLKLAYEKLSLAVGNAISPIVNFFNSLSSGSDQLDETTSKLDTFGKIAATLGAGALLGAGIGAGISAGALTAPGAIVGTLAAAFALLASSTDDAAVKQEKLKKVLEATTVGMQAQAAKVIALAQATSDLADQNAKLTEDQKKGIGEGPSSSDLLKVESSYKQQFNAVRDLLDKQEELRASSKALARERAALGPEVQTAVELPKTQIQIGYQRSQLELTTNPDERIKIEQKLQDLLKQRSQLQAQAAGSEEVPQDKIDKYIALSKAIEDTNAKIREVAPAVAAAQTALDAFAAKYGFLTAEQEKTARSTQRVSAELSGLKDALEGIDPQLQAAKWNDYNTRIAQATVELNQLNDSATILQSLELAKEIDIKIDENKIENSITNANRKIQALETAAVTISIDSPELPRIISDLESAKVTLNELQNKKTSITIDVIQQGFASGDIPTSLNKVNELIQLLDGYIANISINSPELPGKVAELLQAKQLLDEVNDKKASITIELLQQGIKDGTLNDSLNNTNQLIQLLDGRAASLSVNSPELPKITADLLTAKQKLDELNDKKATITIELLQKGIKEGSISDSIKNVNDSIKLLEDRVITLGIDSPKLPEVVSQLEQAKSELDALDTRKAIITLEKIEKGIQEGTIVESMDVLQNKVSLLNGIIAKISVNAPELPQLVTDLENAETKIQALKEGRYANERMQIQRTLDESKAASDIQIANIRSEITAIEDKANLQINALRELTDSEKALNDLRTANLKARANDPSLSEEERLAAKAQLERLNNEQKIADIRKQAATDVGNLNKRIAQEEDKIRTAMENAAQAARDKLAASLSSAANSAKIVAGELKDLDGKVISVYIKQVPITPGRWLGGPVESGQQYRVNEIGREGFLSASGRLTPIDKPQNSLWRAPSSGTVIPAHIMNSLDIPKTGVNVNARGAVAANNGSQMQRLIKNMALAFMSSQTPATAINELSNTQASQAVQIGKLSRAVNDLVRKDWNVNVHVRPNASLDYLNALNNRL